MHDEAVDRNLHRVKFDQMRLQILRVNERLAEKFPVEFSLNEYMFELLIDLLISIVKSVLPSTPSRLIGGRRRVICTF